MANRVTLEKLSSKTDQSIREKMHVGADKYEGVMLFGPSVGRSFAFFRDDKEYMHTSEVKSIQFGDDNTLTFKTRNSEYKLTIGAQQEPI